MKEGRRDFGEVKELFEERRQREEEPCIELLLAKISSIVRQFLNEHRLAVYQDDGHVVRDAKAIPELLFGQNVNEAFRLRASNSCTLSASFLASTAYTGGSDVPSY